MTSRAQAEEYVKKYEAMHLYRQLGAPLHFIGGKFGGLSKERVRQILMKRDRYLVLLNNSTCESDELTRYDAIFIGNWLHAWGAEHEIVFKE